MIQVHRSLFVVGVVCFAISLSGASLANGPTATPSPSPAPAPQANAVNPKDQKAKKVVVTRRVVSRLSTTHNTTTVSAANRTLVGASNEQRGAFEEAKNLIVPSQPYLIKYEDEENYGKVSESGQTHTELTFSESEVEDYRKAIDTIGQYRNQLRTRCSGNSPRVLTQALDKYLHSLSLFNRKALPIVADISEANPSMVLIVNRNVLVDAPVLTSRYLKFKKQRFKESMNKFSTADQELIDSLVSIAKILRVKISDSDWNKSYVVRENGLEMISMWPRETIFEATDRLNDARETVCIVDLSVPKPVQQASKEKEPDKAE